MQIKKNHIDLLKSVYGLANEPDGNTDKFKINDSKIESIIEELDNYSRSYNGHEYGLPMHGYHIHEMKKIVRNCLINNKDSLNRKETQ